jgi:predicted MFS family arabinose efflux permease
MASVLAVPVMAPAISADTGLPPSLLGAYSFVMWSAATLISGAVGGLIARLGAPRVVQLSLFLCAAGLAAGATGTTAGLVVTPALIGAACAIETPASSEILARLAAPEHRTFIFSLKQTGVQVGGVLAGIAFPAALAGLGWRGAMAALAGFLLAAVLALETLRPRLAPHAPPSRPRGASPGRLAFVLRNRALRDLATASFLFHAMQACMNVFLVAYLVGEHAYSLAAAGLLLAAAQFGGFIGRLGFGLAVGPRLGAIRLLVGVGFGMSAAAAAVALTAGVAPSLLLGLLCFLFGLTAAGWNGVFLAEVAREAPPGEIARVTGGVMITAYAGLILGPVAFSAAATAAATLGAGYLLLAGATFAGALVLRRAGHARPRAV